MLKNMKKVLLPIVALVLMLGVGLGIYFGFAGNDVHAEIQTSQYLQVKGASVRVLGEKPGLKFVVEVDNTKFTKAFGTVKEYGILLAFGDVEASQMTIGGTANSKGIKDFAFTTADMEKDGWTESLTIYNIPAASYGQNMTTLMYAKLENDTIVYGAEACTRNLADVSRYLYNRTTDEDLGEVTGNLIKTVAEACKVKVTDADGNVSFYQNYIWKTAKTGYFTITSDSKNVTLELVRGTYKNTTYLYDGIKLYGAYRDVALDQNGNRSSDSDIVGESILTAPVLQTGSQTEVNGCKLTASTAYKLRENYHTPTIAYCNISYSGTVGITEAQISGSTTELTAQIHNNIVIDNCYFKSDVAGSQDLSFVSNINGISITNCTFDSIATELVGSEGVYEDYAIKIPVVKSKSSVVIKDNTFKHQGAYYVIAIGEGQSQTAYDITIENNVLSTDTSVPLGGNGIAVLRTKGGGNVNIIHNTIATSQYFNAVLVSGTFGVSEDTTVSNAINLLYNKFYWAEGTCPSFRTSSTSKFTRITFCCATTNVAIKGNYFSDSTSTNAFKNMTSNSNAKGSYFGKNGINANNLKTDNGTVTAADVAYSFYVYNKELAEYVAANGAIDTISAFYGGIGNANINLYIPSFAEKHSGKLFIINGVLYYDPANVTSTQSKSAGWENIAPYEVTTVDAEIKAALTAVAYAYFDQTKQINYDEYYNRRYLVNSPESATSVQPLILDCSSFVNSVYKETFGTDIISSGVTTSALMQYAAANTTSTTVPYYYAITGTEDDAAKATVLNALQTSLQFGDVLVYRTDNNTAGHVMLYLGGNQFIHATGASYRMNAATPGAAPIDPNEAYERATDATSEKDGAVQFLDASALFDESGARYIFGSKNMDHVCILRPLATKTASDLTTATKARVALGRASIEKTVKDADGNVLNNYSTVLPGDELTITITVSNKGDEGTELAPFTITDTIPVGTSFKEVTGTATGYNNDADVTLSWTRSSALSSSYSRSYIVVVPNTATVGTVINVNGGNVNGIPTNDITLTVGDDVSIVTTCATEKIGDAYPSGSFEFINAVYSELGYQKFASMTPADVFTSFASQFENGALKTSYPYYTMAAKTLFGGYQLTAASVNTTWQSSTTRVRLVKADYLQAGDVIVVADNSLSASTTYEAYLFLDEDTILGTENGVVALKTSTRADHQTAEQFLEQLEAYKYFIVLRPATDAN